MAGRSAQVLVVWLVKMAMKLTGEVWQNYLEYFLSKKSKNRMIDETDSTVSGAVLSIPEKHLISPQHLGISINKAYHWTVNSAKDCHCRVIIVVSRMVMKHS